MNDHIRGEDLAAYVDGLLSAAKRSELENHFSRCPACLDELLEITALRHGQDKIPTQFLNQALGKKNKAAQPALPLSLVFEIAAALVIVVFIGYFFLNNNRFWQTGEQQKPLVMTDKNVSFREPFASVREQETLPLPAQKRGPTAAGKTSNELTKADADHAPATPKPTDKKENVLKKELARTAMAPQAVGEVQTDFAAKDQPAVKVAETKTVAAEKNLERLKEPGAGVALPVEAKQEKSKDEKTLLKSSAAVRAVAGAVPPPSPPVRIEGDVAWADLRNPELLIAWSWFPKGLALELRIDSAGTVTAAVASGKVDERIAAQGESEARKLLFSVSEKKLRRAHLVAKDLPPN